MTITLHWWMVPAAIAVLGGFFWVKAGWADDGCFGGMAEMFASIGLFAVALAICVGHWL
jgi:cytochrome b561